MISVPQTYDLVFSENVKELKSKAYLLRHKKSGARLFLLSNEDKNKVFTIGFRTPVADSTGVAHILEHSVLCGSEKFPVKDPFMEMEKSSLQTYLNAMTFADKTIYPVASCNDKAFQNLMDVYLDAVLHPLIYHNEKIFQQEGWHYHLDSQEGELLINGVVYNEMKGVFSNPEDILERYAQSTLFPDTTYFYESGGDPQEIPNLSYEDFLAFHRTYYHPSNSYIYLYGDMNMEEKLRWLDEKYLQFYEKQEISSTIARQKPFLSPLEKEIVYPIAREEKPEGKTFLSQQWVVGDILDPILYQAFQVLEYALLGTQGAPLRQALLDSGMGKDVVGGYRNSGLQPYFSLTLKGSEKEKKQEFLDLIRNTLEKLVKDGIGEKPLLAALNSLEFRNREADFGAYPKGLIYGIECFDSWLYDENQPLMHLKYEETFSFLRSQIHSGYFEDLIRRYLLENSHCTCVLLCPCPGMEEDEAKKTGTKLKRYCQSLSFEEREALISQTENLALYQDEENTKEALDTLPRLTMDDLEQTCRFLSSRQYSISGVPAYHHETFTGGIIYLRFLFDVSRIPQEKWFTLSLLRSMLGVVNTERFSYADLSHEINIYTGGMHAHLVNYEQVEELGSFCPYFDFQISVMDHQLEKGLELTEEILTHSLFNDEKRLRELVEQLYSRAQVHVVQAGHSTAISRASSYGNPISWYNEQLGGVDYLRQLKQLEKEINERAGQLGESLQKLAKEIFQVDGLFISATCDAKSWEHIQETLKDRFLCKEHRGKQVLRIQSPMDKKNEGFQTTAQVQYVAQCGNYQKKGLVYHGSLRVLRGIISADYLWQQLRVKGGAYGCMCNFGRNGMGFFASYRDPHVKRTLDAYAGIPEFVRNLDLDQESLEGFVISTIGSMDRPMNPLEWGEASLNATFCGLTDELRQQDRQQVIHCTVEDLRNLSGHMEAILQQNQICAVGNATKLEQSRENFICVEPLLRDE